MCVELPCGYSSQTIAKTVAYSGIVSRRFLSPKIELLQIVIKLEVLK